MYSVSVVESAILLLLILQMQVPLALPTSPERSDRVNGIAVLGVLQMFLLTFMTQEHGASHTWNARTISPSIFT